VKWEDPPLVSATGFHPPPVSCFFPPAREQSTSPPLVNRDLFGAGGALIAPIFVALL